MPTMIEKLGIDRMTVAERKELVRELWTSLPEEERTLPPVAVPLAVSPPQPVPPADAAAPRRITREEAAEWKRTFVPRNDWERRLMSLGTDCGVSLSDEAVSSEGIYD